jgi:hypothetical protein
MNPKPFSVISFLMVPCGIAASSRKIKLHDQLNGQYTPIDGQQRNSGAKGLVAVESNNQDAQVSHLAR